jgi:guanine nucleotide-binding protein subunit alpha, other
MRIIYAGGFSKAERKHWRMIIFNNLVEAFQILFFSMQEHKTEFEDKDNIVWFLESFIRVQY